MNLDKKVVFSDTVFAQEVDGEMVLLDMNSENYFGMDEVGSTIWQAIEEHNGDLRKVLEILLEQYDVDAKTLQKDLLHFVENLQTHGLVKVESR